MTSTQDAFQLNKEEWADLQRSQSAISNIKKTYLPWFFKERGEADYILFKVFFNL